MNNSLDRVFDELVRLLQGDIVPLLDDDALRAQAVAAVFMLKNLQLRVDWSAEPLLRQIRAQDALFVQVHERGGAPGIPLSRDARVPARVPGGAELLALRDEGDALVGRLIEHGAAAATVGGPGAAFDIDDLLLAYMRAAVDVEMRHTPPPMFAEMSGGTRPAVDRGIVGSDDSPAAGGP